MQRHSENSVQDDPFEFGFKKMLYSQRATWEMHSSHVIRMAVGNFYTLHGQSRDAFLLKRKMTPDQPLAVEKENSAHFRMLDMRITQGSNMPTSREGIKNRAAAS